MGREEINKSVKKTFLAGLFVTFPLVLSTLAVVWLFNLLDGMLGHMLDRFIGKHYPGLAIALSIVGIYGIGIIATTMLGKRVIISLESMALRLPIFKSIYSTFKQLGDAFSPENRGAFKKFVIVEYPRKGMHSFGFLTKQCILRNDNGTEESYNTVYIPTNNLYLGDVTLFKESEVTYTDLSIEDGIKILLSAGIAAPNFINKQVCGPDEVETLASLTPSDAASKTEASA
ncbi:MAG TPA: DUF502 domain-containing protein, partial [Nitrospirota bacterium]